MRALVAVAAMLACLVASAAGAQPPTDAPVSPQAAPAVEGPPPGTLQYQILHVPEEEQTDPVAKSADEVLRQERRRTNRPNVAPPVAAAPPAELDLAKTLRPVATPTMKLNTFVDEDRRRAVLQGRSGPIAQASAAVGDKDWFALIWAIATLGVWGIGGGLALWLGYAGVRAFNRH